MPLWGRKNIVVITHRAKSENKCILDKLNQSDKLKKILFDIRKTNAKQSWSNEFVFVSLVSVM